MRQKKKIEGSKLEPEDKPEACVKCSKLQNGSRHGSLEETETQSKQTTLSTLKSVLKRSASHKREKSSVKNSSEKSTLREPPFVGGRGKTKNRVQFDETQNKYFEADYVILIHEEDYDLDDYYDEGSPYDDDEEEEEEEEDEDEDELDYEDGLGQGKICCSNPNCNNAVTLSSDYPGYVYSTAGLLTNLNYPRMAAAAAIERNRFDFSTQNDRNSSANRCGNEKCPNCSNYFDFETTYKAETSQDYGDQVTLSPPEGYKDGGGGSQCCQHHGLQIQNASIEITGKKISTPLAEGEIQFEEEEEREEKRCPTKYQQDEMDSDETATKVENGIVEKAEEAAENNSIRREEKPEQLKQRFIVETITKTTVTERRILTESHESNPSETTAQITEESKTGGEGGEGILKGGKYWKNSSAEKMPGKSVNYNEISNEKKSNVETENSKEKEDVDDDGEKNEESSLAEADKERIEKKTAKENEFKSSAESTKQEKREEIMSPESTELTLTFKLGHQLLVSNSLKPNSAMRQLFPNPRFLSPPPPPEDGEFSERINPIPPKQFLVTADGLRLFEESKRSKIFGGENSQESDRNFIVPAGATKTNEEFQCNESFQRTIERNTLRRSLVKYSYEYRNKRLSEKKKNENSLEERIRQLTCGVDEEKGKEEEKESISPEEKKEETENTEPSRASPQGEESQEPENVYVDVNVSNRTEPVSPFPVNSTSASGNSTYRKLTDLFSRKQSNPPPIIEDINRNVKTESAGLQCDLVLNSENLTNVYSLNSQGQRNSFVGLKSFQPRIPAGSDAKKQFLSTLAPLAACVNPEDKAERYRLIEGGDRFQPTGRESENPVQDPGDGPKKLGNQPDVIAETPQNETPNDELALFVQQDHGRIEKLKKRYSATDDKSDDEDDYGFNKRPFVKGIKTQFNASCDTPHSSLATRSQGSHRVMCPNNKHPSVTATGTATATVHTNWPYYSQENAVSKLRKIYAGKPTEETNSYGLHGTPADYRGCPEVGNGTYAECRGPTTAQTLNHVNQGHQQNAYSGTNTFYRCHPIRFGGYSELSNYRLRHPPHSPPPLRRIMTSVTQPNPISSEECKVKVENRIFFNRTGSNYGNANAENCVGPKPNLPDGSSLVSPSNESPTIPESTYRRRTVPNVHNPCLQMKFSPVNYHQGVLPTASIRFSASCSPHAIVDESTDSHYSGFPQPVSQGNAVGVIRVEQGQQMIRVPVPYATGTPVQVHLMTGRLGRCDSPQKPSSPQGAIKVPMQPLNPHNHYLVAKGIQTVQSYSATATASPPPQPPPPSANPLPDEKSTIATKTVDFEKQGKAIAEELQHRQKSALSRSVSQEGNHQVRPSLRSASPVIPHERGVPEGAASSSVHDCQPLQPKNPAAPPSGNTVYYTMNV